MTKKHKADEREGSIELALLLRVVYKPNGMTRMDLEELLEAWVVREINRGALTGDTPAEVLMHESQVRDKDVAEVGDTCLDALSEELRGLEELAEVAEDVSDGIKERVKDIKSRFVKEGIDV